MQVKIIKGSLLILLLLAVAFAVVYRDHLDVATLEAWVNGAGVAGPLVFMLVYIIGTVLFFPGSVLTLAGGALFGPVMGTIYNLTGATLGAALSFLIARYLASHWVEQKTAGRMKQLKHGVEKEGWRFVAFVRLVPLFPFNLLNYALGLTRIKFSHYVIASWVCMLPGAIAYTYLGYAGREAFAGGEGIIQKGLLALALLALVAFIPRFIGNLRKGPMLSAETLHQRLDDGEDMLVLDVREATEFSGELGHIPGAVNISLKTLAENLAHIADYAEKPVAIVCHTDKRSAKAARLLLRNGFSNVQVVEKGMTAWNSGGYPVD